MQGRRSGERFRLRLDFHGAEIASLPQRSAIDERHGLGKVVALSALRDDAVQCRKRPQQALPTLIDRQANDGQMPCNGVLCARRSS
jgi:hypothetical protein